MVVDKFDVVKVKPKSKSKSKTEFESKSKYEPCTDKEDMSSEIANMVKKMIRRKNFYKRGVKKEIQKKDQPNKVNIGCFECNKKETLQVKMS